MIIRVLLAAVIAFAGVAAAFAQNEPTPAEADHIAALCLPYQGAEPTNNSGSMRTFGEFAVIFCPAGFGQLFLVTIHGVIVEAREEATVDVAYFGDDVTGTGFPALVVLTTSGSQCCSTARVYEVAPTRFRALAAIDGGFGEVTFAPAAGVAGLAATVRDPIFAYWRVDLDQSVMPTVRLTYDPFKNAYRFSAKLMAAAPPDQAGLRAEAAALRPKIEITKTSGPMNVPYVVPPALWERMLGLIYSGNGNLARDYLTWAWPEDEVSRTAFWHELVDCNLGESEYFSDILVLNRWPQTKTDPLSCQHWAQ